MEFSPLKYLDYDVSQMLCEKVRLSHEKLSRDYHIELYDKFSDWIASLSCKYFSEFIEGRLTIE